MDECFSLFAGTIDYYTFIEAFDDPRGRNELVENIKRSGNHHVNKHRGDDFGLSAEQAEQKLRSKLRENFAVSQELDISVTKRIAVCTCPAQTVSLKY